MNTQTINTLNNIFLKHKNDRICVLGTSCCGKTHILKHIPICFGCLDLDEELWPLLTKEEIEFVDQKWTPEIGDFMDSLVYEKISVKPGHPLFTTLIIDCEVVIYLDISDDLLVKHCEKRGVDFIDSKNMKKSIEDDILYHKKKGDKTFYHLTLTE